MPGSAPSSSPSTCRCPARATGSAASTGRSTTARCPPSGVRSTRRRPARRSTCSTRRSTGPTWSGSSSSVSVPVVVKGILDREDADPGRRARGGRHRRLEPRWPPARRSDADDRGAAGHRRRGRRPAGGAARRRHPARHRRRHGARPRRAGRARRPDAALGSRRRAGRRARARCSSCLREELATALHLTGCRSVAELSAGEPRPARSAARRITAP